MIYLASQSPRRQQLLKQIGIDFEQITIEIDESPMPSEVPLDYVRRVCEDKAKAAWDLVVQSGKEPHPVLTADTTVFIEGQILGKPRDRQHARQMLLTLSGKVHQVASAICIHKDGISKQQTVVSKVTFKTLSGDEIEAYLDSKESYGKAGSYAIQGLAACFITHISGSYSAIMGLPLYETAQMLQNFDIFCLKQVKP